MDLPDGGRSRYLAGEEGEYHHSRNLIKKMANGREYWKLSSTTRETRRRADFM
jgi:hypothetical protein